MTASAVKITGLTKHYKNFTLGPMELQVEKGTAVALVGPNGSGKSTIFRLMIKLLQAEQGEIEIFGQNMVEKESIIKQKIGFVGDLYSTFGNLTVKELASLVSYWYPTWEQKRYEDLLERYRIDENVKYANCSKGTQKKIEFVFALAHNPDLLILDEPSAGIDLISQRKMKEELTRYLESGEKSILMATHILDDVKQLCDCIYIVNEGKVINYFAKDEVYEKWARLWVTTITAAIKKHPNVIAVIESPPQIITDNLAAVEKMLISEDVAISHLQRLDLDEVVEYLTGG